MRVREEYLDGDVRTPFTASTPIWIAHPFGRGIVADASNERVLTDTIHAAIGRTAVPVVTGFPCGTCFTCFNTEMSSRIAVLARCTVEVEHTLVGMFTGNVASCSLMAVGIFCVGWQVTLEACPTGTVALRGAVLVSIAHQSVRTVVVLDRVDAWTRRVDASVVHAPVERVGIAVPTVVVDLTPRLEVDFRGSCISIAEDVDI